MFHDIFVGCNTFDKVFFFLGEISIPVKNVKCLECLECLMVFCNDLPKTKGCQASKNVSWMRLMMT